VRGSALLAAAMLCAGAAGACHGPPVAASPDGVGGGRGGSGGTPRDAGAGGGGGGGAGPPLGALSIVPGTGFDGIAYVNMLALDSGYAYASIFDLTESVPGLSPLTPNVIVKSISLADGSTRRLSGPGEAAEEVLFGDSAPVTTDADYVYWFSRTRSDPGELMRLRRAPKGGGTEEEIVAIDDLSQSTPLNAIVIAADGTHVYWASSGAGIYRCPATKGCPGGPETLVTGTDDIVSMVVRGDWLYWGSYTDGRVWRHGLAGGGDRVLDSGPTQSVHQACSLTVDGNELFWIQCLWPYEVHRIDLVGLTSQVIASVPTETVNQQAAGSIVVAGDVIYFIGSDHVFRMPRTAAGTAAVETMATIVVPGLSTYADAIIGVDNQFVYFQGTNPNTVGVSGNRADYVLRLAR
jgi:hypothetical protein